MSERVDRRVFLKAAGLLGALSISNRLPPPPHLSLEKTSEMKTIEVIRAEANFEKEKLRFPFGFKGGYLTELWQAVSRLESANGHEAIGIATQSVLYGDADLFSRSSEATGNALMFLVTSRALQLLERRSFTSPIDLLDDILPEIVEIAKQLTGEKTLNPNFVYNALVGMDNAAWLLYAAENGLESYDEMIMEDYRPALGYRNDRIGILFQVSYDMSKEVVLQAVRDGYFIFKIKTGYPGDQQAMLEGDMRRLHELHDLLKDIRTEETSDGKLVYTMDANGRYERKETFARYLDYAREIGAFDQILFYEEPFSEENGAYVGDLGIRIAADESVYDVASAKRRIEQGYQAIVLKSIAKTLSQTLKILEYAHNEQIPCSCSDLTINPILLDWHKNMAARLPPFPGLGMPLMETNGATNYVNWETMRQYHPQYGATWMEQRQGKFLLNEDFYVQSGGIYQHSAHYKRLFVR
ncbi:enolase C-terminal domain-like protein [Parapedobacter pyrenivorans]|uniref:enolase C-terminal domain-like protein n=1 Tax=Parapedobacter pyrenivorans TaxID=1305674 RepID=UPI00333E3CE5